MSATTPNNEAVAEAPIRQYLRDVNMASILEAFVTDCVAEKPKDVLTYMEAYSKKTRAMLRDNATGEQWTIAKAWRAHPGLTDDSTRSFGECFFNLLFIQQRVMRRTVFEKVANDIPAAALLLAGLFGKAATGELDHHRMSSLAAAGAVDVPIESYHYQTIITTILLTLRQSMPEDVWEATSTEWRDFCTDTGLKVEAVICDSKDSVAGQHADVAQIESGVIPPADAVPMSAFDSWDKLPNAQQESVARSAIDVLLLQHAPLKRSFFEGVNVAELSLSLVPLLPKLARGEITDDDIRATGIVAKAASLSVQSYHVDYGATALLMALSMAFGRNQWGSGLAEVWRTLVTAAAEKTIALIASEEEL